MASSPMPEWQAMIALQQIRRSRSTWHARILHMALIGLGSSRIYQGACDVCVHIPNNHSTMKGLVPLRAVDYVAIVHWMI